MMMVLIQSIILTTVEALACRIFFDSFLIRKYQNRKVLDTMLFTLLICGFVFITCAFLESDWFIFKATVGIFYISIIMGILYYGKYLQVLFFSVVYYGIIIYIDIIMIAIIEKAISLGFSYIIDGEFNLTITGLLCKSVLFICVVVINRKFKGTDVYSRLTNHEWIQFLYFPIMTLISMIVIAVVDHSSDNTILLVTFGLILSNFILFYMIQDMVERERQMQNMRLSEERSKNQIEMYHHMKELYRGQRRKVHEFKNQIECIQGLLQQGKYTDVSNYVAGINELIINSVDYVNTNHPIANAIINQKLKLARSKEIPIIMSINDLSEIPFTEEDIVILVANLLNNAMEASEKIEGGSKEIKFKFIYEKGQIIISSRNPVRDNIKIIDNKISTTKSDKMNHGIGLENIEAIIKKYNGEKVVSCRDGYFTYTIIIRVQKVER